MDTTSYGLKRTLGIPVEQADARVREALAAEGFGVLTEIDVRATLDLADRIDRALAGLPERQREVITLRDVEGWSAEDVCNALGLSVTNQRVILHRARERVRNELRDYLAESNGCGDEPVQ